MKNMERMAKERNRKRFERNQGNWLQKGCFSKKGIRLIACGLSTLLLLGALSGCGNSGSRSDSANFAGNGASYNKSSGVSASESARYDGGYADEALWDSGADYEKYEESTAVKPNDDYSKTSASKRKLIKNVNMKVETQEYEQLMANLESRVKELGGYVQSLDSYNGSNYDYSRSRRYANAVVRIPQQKLDEFVGSVSDMANVISRNESVEDVTLQYVDMKSHKESLQVEQQRLLALLEKAELLEDIITLENRLTNVRYQIESMESSLRTFDDMVDYSTVSLRIDEVVVYTKVEEKEETAWERMANGFMDSLISVKNGFVEFSIWFVVNIPYLVIWAIVITIGILIFKKIRGGKKTKKERKNKKNQTQDNGETSVVGLNTVQESAKKDDSSVK